MQEWQATVVLVFLFALRCIVPLVITIGLGYLMNRLVDRWEAEEALLVGQQTPELELQSATSKQDDQSGIKLPCWITRNCPPDKRENCPAFQQSYLPCWAARTKAEGSLPANCPGCPVYDNTLVLT